MFNELKAAGDTNMSPEQFRLRDKIYSFTTKICACCVANSLSYSLKHFLVDLLNECTKNTQHELPHFEALLGLTQFTSDNEEIVLKLYHQKKLWVTL